MLVKIRDEKGSRIADVPDNFEERWEEIVLALKDKHGEKLHKIKIIPGYEQGSTVYGITSKGEKIEIDKVIILELLFEQQA